jgi:hypothetical protein
MVFHVWKRCVDGSGRILQGHVFQCNSALPREMKLPCPSTRVRLLASDHRGLELS